MQLQTQAQDLTVAVAVAKTYYYFPVPAHALFPLMDTPTVLFPVVVPALALSAGLQPRHQPAEAKVSASVVAFLAQLELEQAAEESAR